jgi:hypothetical protein
MAREEKYSKEELAKLEALKKKSELEAILKKEKIETSVLEEERILKEREDKKKDDESDGGGGTTGGGGVSPIDDPRERPDPTGGVTIVETVKVKETRAMPVVVDSDNFVLNYIIEQIPRPDINKIYGLSINNKNIFDKQYWGLDQDDGKFKVIHKLKNFVNQNGQTVSVSVNGVLGTPFEVVVYNETDSTYYDPNPINGSVSFRHGFNTIKSVVKNSYKSPQASKGEDVQLDSPDDVLETNINTSAVSFVIPFSSTEKVYKISLLKIDSATYDESVPLYGVEEKPPFIITQLPDPTTTIKFEDDDNFTTATGSLEIKHAPYARLNSNIYTKGEYTLDMSVTSRRQLSLNSNLMGNKLLNQNLRAALSDTDEALYSTTDVKKVDLTASIVDNIGYVKGTIILGRACYRSCDLVIPPGSVFSLDNDIK